MRDHDERAGGRMGGDTTPHILRKPTALNRRYSLYRNGFWTR